MIKRYCFEDLRILNYPPRIMVSMELFGDGFRTGYNRHYSLDSDIRECLGDFFSDMKKENPKQTIDLKRSKLTIQYLDLPENAEIILTDFPQP